MAVLVCVVGVRAFQSMGKPHEVPERSTPGLKRVEVQVQMPDHSNRAVEAPRSGLSE